MRPDFEGREVDYVTVRLKSVTIPTGEVKHHGAEFYVLTRCVVSDIQHPVDKDGALERRQVATVEAGWLIDQFTATQAIDAAEEPKLPGLGRAEFDVRVENDTVILSAGGKDTEKLHPEGDLLVHAETGEVILEDASGSQAPEAESPDAAAPSDDGQGDAPVPSEEPNLAGETAPPETAPAERLATKGQRLAITRNVSTLDEKLTNEYVSWASKNRVEMQPDRMTFDEARRTLVFFGDRTNSEAE